MKRWRASSAVVRLFRPACAFSHDICERVYPAEVFTASESAEESERHARGSPDWTDTFCSAYFLASSVIKLFKADSPTLHSVVYPDDTRDCSRCAHTSFHSHVSTKPDTHLHLLFYAFSFFLISFALLRLILGFLSDSIYFHLEIF